MGPPFVCYCFIALSIWCYGVATNGTTQPSTSTSLPGIYEVEDVIEHSNTSCRDCDQVKLHPPKSEMRQTGGTARFRCVVPLQGEISAGLRWTHNGRKVTKNSKYDVRLYVWKQGLFTQLKIRNVTIHDKGEVALHVPPYNRTFRANLTVVDPVEATVGEPCFSQRNCVDNNTYCLMPGRVLNGTCICRRKTPVYIRERSGCFPAAQGRDTCFHSEQCRFFVLGSQCINNQCLCPGNTVVAFGACLPALALGSPCSDALGRCSAFMSYCDSSGTCACLPDAREKKGTCHIRRGVGGVSDWRTWLCYTLAIIAISGVLGHAYYHRGAIANYCKHRLSSR
ncbi:uncharacterized protein LOC135400288 isoform X2 [Ornithodoros turicata]|uniref:uncharacterized protein LOC135400288 isoform X2 n=1 Tax=Ornithodoros turicata TaxID=34597 RepID=UPI003139288E